MFTDKENDVLNLRFRTWELQ